MNELRNLQLSFLHYLLRQPSDMVEHIESTPAMSASDRLDIYGSAYNLRLKEAITTDYDKLHGYLGDEQFDQLMDCYIEKYPSHTTNLRYFSINMPDLLQEQAPFNQFPVLAELARIEFAFANSFDAESTDVSTIDDLATIAPEQWGTLTFEFQKSVELLSINTNSFAIWKALSNEETPPEAEQLDHPVKWVIWRRADLVSHYRPISLAEAQTMQLAMQGKNFAELCEALLDFYSEEETPLKAITFLQSWIQDEQLSALG